MKIPGFKVNFKPPRMTYRTNKWYFLKRKDNKLCNWRRKSVAVDSVDIYKIL